MPSAYFIHEGRAPGRWQTPLMTALRLRFGVAVASRPSLWVCKRSWICNRVLMRKRFCSGLQTASWLSAFCFRSAKTVLSNHCRGALQGSFYAFFISAFQILLMDVDCQKAVIPFCTSQCKAIEEKLSWLSLGPYSTQYYNQEMAHRNIKKKINYLRFPLLFNNASGYV